MLRHLLMTPPPEPRRVLPRRLQSLAHDVIRPLYYYVVPHRVPRRRELEILCTCPYPLFTLCTPRTSPYDMTDKEQNVSSETRTLHSTEAAHQVGSHVMGEFPVKAELFTSKKINNKLDNINSMVKNKEDYENKQYKRKRTIKNDVKGDNNFVNSTMQALHSAIEHNKTERSALQEKEKEEEEQESSNRLFQVKARGMRRLRWSRTILHPWELWRKQHTTYMHTIHPNVIPGRPACYRCDICDGFQPTHSNIAADTSSLGSSSIISRSDADEIEQEIENRIAGNSKMENTQSSSNTHKEMQSRLITLKSNHHVGKLIEPQSPLESSTTEMVNEQQLEKKLESEKEKENTKDIAQVAQLRYLDPFRVEVHQRPPLTSLAFNLMRQFYAQLRRCGIHVHELSKRVKYVPLNSIRNARCFDSWITQERKRRFHLLQSSSTSDKMKYYAHGVHLLEGASYAIRFAVAVYGLPYELGYFNSVQGLLKLQAEPHCRYVYATSQEQMDSMKRMLHGDVLHSHEQYEFALSRYSVNVNEASFAVVIDHASQIVIVTFRGTLTLADAVVDIMEGYVNVNLCREPLHTNSKHEINKEKEVNCISNKEISSTLHTRIPVGFFESVRNAALTLVPALNAIFAKHKNYVLYVTGHSLGAVQASLFHLLYCTSFITIAVVNDPEKAAFMPSEQHKKEDQKIEETDEDNCKAEQNDETNANDINESSTRDDTTPVSSSSSSEAIADAIIKVKCNKVHTFAFAPAPMMEANILSELQKLLHQEEEEEMQKQTVCVNSLNSFVYGQDPVSRVDIRSFLNVFAPLNSGKHEAMIASVANAENCAKADCQHKTNETNITVHNVKRKSTAATIMNNNNMMSFDVADTCVPTLGIPGNLYCIPHTSRRCFFNVEVQAQWRKQLILTPEAMVHHFPVHYLRAVNKLRMHYINQLNALRATEHKAKEHTTEEMKERVLTECQKKFTQVENSYYLLSGKSIIQYH